MSKQKDPKPEIYTTHSNEDTILLGAKLAAMLEPGQMLILRGDLGAGKTTLIKGIAQALEAAEADEVTSPTFTLMHEYEGFRAGMPIRLLHLDVYRLETERQLDSLGLDELVEPDSLVLIEWGEKFPSIVRHASGEIQIESIGGDSRRITVTLHPHHPALLPA